jgi:hypothetical protein
MNKVQARKADDVRWRLSAMEGRSSLPSIDERVAFLEGRVSDHTGAVAKLRTDVRDLRGELRDLRGEVIRRFEISDAKMDALSARVDVKFIWLVGIQVAILIALVGALWKI